MDAVVRSGRPLLIALVVAAAVAQGACGGPGGGGVIGVSDRVPTGRGVSVRPDGGSPRDGTTALPPDYRSTFHKMNRERFVSQGHAAGRWDVDVWANDAGKAALASRSREVPAGAILVEEHHERAEGAARGPVMVMEKRAPGSAPDHGDWRWAVVGAGGQLVSEGVIDACAGCHDDAPIGGLFPIVD